MSDSKSFIEVQFPVSKVSKESYKERKANLGQTLTGLGKWWGRKPLILVRTSLLGLLMPASDNPKKDREIFLKILTMDDSGLWLRKYKSIEKSLVYDLLTLKEKELLFNVNDTGLFDYKKNFKEYENQLSITFSDDDIEEATKKRDKYKKLKERFQKPQDLAQYLAFHKMSYDERLTYCRRPEEVDLEDPKEWAIINSHLHTHSSNLRELIQELGIRKFGEVPTVGDCFSGGGSIPFEAARMGFNVFASDLNPIAMLLTWASLNINGASNEEVEKIRIFQEKVYNSVKLQVENWGIEKNEEGWKALSYLYCNEVSCPECGYKVPLSSTWIIGKGTNTIAILHNNPQGYFDIEIKQGVSSKELIIADNFVTSRENNLWCPNCLAETPIAVIRNDRKNKTGEIQYGLRKWEKHEFIPRQNDVFQDRLYCIKYEELKYDAVKDKYYQIKHYVAPNENDIIREQKVVQLLNENFNIWQKSGYIPSDEIIEGEKTAEPIRNRGWKYWHQLFNPRQLLIHGKISETVSHIAENQFEKVVGLLGINKCCNWSSKLSKWNPAAVIEKVSDTYSNQALNTMTNFSTRSLSELESSWIFNINNYYTDIIAKFNLGDARHVSHNSTFWVTDPPYADAINYHELSEFFLSWNKIHLQRVFPNWYSESKRVLAVQGKGIEFNQSMVEIYNNLAKNMPDNGMQIVMFTHQDPSVWADLTLIMWSAGLQVTTAWNIATETEATGLKQGNYIKGTVLLILRKQSSEATAYRDELYPEIEHEVKSQIDSMRDIDDKEDPNFNDPDYLLAAYAASLKVLTSYKNIEDIDIDYELSKPKDKNNPSVIEEIIYEAIKIAYDYLIPTGFDSFIWKNLIPEERFYIKGIELEKDHIKELSAYQELARGFGVGDYKFFLASVKANQARVKTAMEFGTKYIGNDDKFSNSLIRNVLMAIHQSIKKEDAQVGRNWLKNEIPDYWNLRTNIIALLEYLSKLDQFGNLEHWHNEALYAKFLTELVGNDGV
ncbi:MAG: methylase [Ignavibacteria bacterium]|nr:methylase [Ignavibacteria bacterium]